MMRIFSLFSGKKRKEEGDYTDFLVAELENLKKEMQEIIGKKDGQIENLTKELEDQKLEVDKLQHQVKQEQEEKQELILNNQETEKLRIKLQEYRDSYDAFSAMIQKTKTECEKNINDSRKKAEQIASAAQTEAREVIVTARRNAKRITDEATASADAYKKSVEEQMKKKADEYRAEYAAKQNRVQKCMDSLNGMHQDLEGLYGKFGEFLRELPTVIEKVSGDKVLDPSIITQKEEFYKTDI